MFPLRSMSSQLRYAVWIAGTQIGSESSISALRDDRNNKQNGRRHSHNIAPDHVASGNSQPWPYSAWIGGPPHRGRVCEDVAEERWCSRKALIS